jgi:DNA-binding FadR family transcriptional regulator
MKNLSQEKKLEGLIADMIGQCLQTGDKFPSEVQLAKDLGVSRTTLRESLSVFEASGIIASQQGSGRYVQVPDISGHITGTWRILLRAKPDLLMEFLEIRYMLEINSLAKAIERVSVKQLRRMGKLVKTMKEKAKCGEAFVACDREFHQTLFDAIGNTLLKQLLTAFWDIFITSHINTVHGDLKKVASQHEKIFEAFAKQDLPLLEKLMEEQFADARYRITQFLVDKTESNAGSVPQRPPLKRA